MLTTRHHNIPASYLVLFKDNHVLLLRRQNTGYQDGNYSLPAGHVDPGENFTQCVIRESQEEAGIELNSKEIEVIHIMHRNSDAGESKERVDAFFIAKDWQGEPTNLEPHKCDDLNWFDLDNLPENTIPYIKQALEHIKNGIFYSEHGWE